MLLVVGRRVGELYHAAGTILLRFGSGFFLASAGGSMAVMLHSSDEYIMDFSCEKTLSKHFNYIF